LAIYSVRPFGGAPPEELTPRNSQNPNVQKLRMIPGQLNDEERQHLTNSILNAPTHPKVALEVGTWKGGGSTLQILQALEQNGEGRLWGIEAMKEIYDEMLQNIRTEVPGASHRFTPLFGFSDKVIPEWLATQSPGFQIDFAFLDGGDNPMEQVKEYQLLDPYIPVGGRLMAHDARMRKGKWLIPYIQKLDHWKCEIHDLSALGLLDALKIAEKPSPASLNEANRCLRKLRLEPVEVVARIVPSRLIPPLLKILPTEFVRSLIHPKRKAKDGGTAP
jgi:predicted O-methyltransferase YrrM